MKRFDVEKYLALYLVLDPELCGGIDGMLRTTELAVANGVTAVQLRAPDWKKRRLVEVGRLLKQLLQGRGVPLLINDHVDVALAMNADGVHVGQDDLPVEAVRALLGPDKIVGFSTTSVEQHAQAPVDLVDYAGLGPVFPTGTKKDATPALGMSEFARALTVSAVPCVAIGGIGPGRIAQLRAAGAMGIAVVSAICGQPDVASATLELRREWDSQGARR